MELLAVVLNLRWFVDMVGAIKFSSIAGLIATEGGGQREMSITFNYKLLAIFLNYLFHSMASNL